MSLKCLVGRHSWTGCKCSACGRIRAEGHGWIGCKCSACGKIRAEGHDWSADCQKCKLCGSRRNTSSSWDPATQHTWKGGCCSVCGKTRNDPANNGKKLVYLCERQTRHSYGHYESDIDRLRKNTVLDEVLALLAEGADVNAREQWGYTALHHTAQIGDSPSYLFRDGDLSVSLAKLLIAHGADVDAIAATDDRDSNVGLRGATPLQVAALNDNIGVLKQLIASGANVDAKSTDGASPLVMAIEWGHTFLARELITNGARLNSTQVHERRTNSRRLWKGHTLLHRAAAEGSTFVAEHLLSLGADANAKCNHGGTPLMEAVIGKHAEMIELLVARGADVNCADNDGLSALAIARNQVGWAVAILERTGK